MQLLTHSKPFQYFFLQKMVYFPYIVQKPHNCMVVLIT